MAYIQFTRNYTDHSNDTGFQFEFFCDRCGNGFMSQFRPNKFGMISEASRGIGNVLGGVFGRASSGSYELANLTRGKAHDDAFAQAVERTGRACLRGSKRALTDRGRDC